ncbi:hypothetical protein MUP77_13475 [Candidatus Bathyarchaeota archaeon]|nr:hypothetical protein [Candidatus Bathyarchaeota archaeon]
MYNLLPLLKGWQYKIHFREATLFPGQAAEPWRIPEMGWLMGAFGVSNDAYGTVKIEYQDANLQTHEVESNPESARFLGALQQDPSGWAQRYFRPNPYSTAGAYVIILFSGGFQGAAWPFVPTTIVRLSLGTESNQASAIVTGTASLLAITNRELFIRSLRQVLNSQANIQVPKEILSLGPVELQQQPNKTDELLDAILTELKQRK